VDLLLRLAHSGQLGGSVFAAGGHFIDHDISHQQRAFETQSFDRPGDWQVVTETLGISDCLAGEAQGGTMASGNVFPAALDAAPLFVVLAGNCL
jgi:hypothetical protein